MKRSMDFCKRALIVLTAVMIALLPAGVFAVSSANAYERQMWDIAGLLSEDQAEELDAIAYAAAEQYQCGIYMVILDDYSEYSSTSAYDAATAIYDSLDIGYGGDRDGVMLLLSLNDRDYALIAHGAVGNAAFTDYGKEQLERKFLDDFGDDDYYQGFRDYIRESEKYLQAEAAGTPVDVSPEGERGGGFLNSIMKLFAGLVTSAMATLGLSKSMKSVRTAVNADHYKVNGSFDLTVQQDRYLRRSVSTRIISEGGKNGNRPGGGGTSIGSGGFSGHSGKF